MQSIGIVIIGMGRSGTSAISGALQTLGVDLGKTLIGANPFNPKGHFENAAVVRLNSAILKSLGSYNGDFSMLDGVDWSAAKAYGALAREILRSEFSSSFIGIKDPRMCRVWPIWETAMTAHGAAIRFLIPIRHPMEVVQSLHGYGLSTNHGLMWWLAYTLDAERHSRTAPRALVPYHDLLGGPRRMLERIAGVLGLQWPQSPEAAEARLDTFLSRSMRHRSPEAPAVRAEADSRILALAESVHQEMTTDGNPARLDFARAEFADLVKACRGWRPQAGA